LVELGEIHGLAVNSPSHCFLNLGANRSRNMVKLHNPKGIRTGLVLPFYVRLYIRQPTGRFTALP